MAFEGASEHFREPHPEISRQLFTEIEHIGVPMKYVIKKRIYNDHPDIVYDENKSVYDNCYNCLRLIRNNIMHANKAYRPDTPERLTDLLDWAERFIDAVYETQSSFSERAHEIKRTMNIESF